MEDLFCHLEAQITALVTQCKELKAANAHLKQVKFALTQEKSILLAKYQQAITHIETMVSHLKAVEKMS